MAKLQRSQFGKLGLLDIIKSAVVSALAAGIAVLQQQLSAGDIDWKVVGTISLSALLAYLSKNLIENENGTFGKVKVNK
jgi:hypothetical protein